MMFEVTALEWRAPWWLAVAGYPWLLALLHWLRGRVRGAAYAEASLQPWARVTVAGQWTPRHWWRQVLLALAWGLFGLALAGPRYAQTTYTPDPAQLPELMIVWDLSRSMTARDVTPDRLERARLKLLDLSLRLRQTKTGVLVYAGSAHVLTPPTTDHDVLRHFLALPRYGMVPIAGSNLSAALEGALTAFTPGQTRRALLLVTDGELPALTAAQRANLLATVDALAQQGVMLHVLGVGTEAGASVLDADGAWLRHADLEVVSRLNTKLLMTLARRGNGRYAPLSDDDGDLRFLYDAGIARAEAGDDGRTPNALVMWRELYQWPLAPAVLLLVLAHWRRRSGASSAPALMVLALVMASAAPVTPAQAADAQRQAYLAYQQHSYQRAQQAYRQVPGYHGRMGEGASAYQLQAYPMAIQQFTLAILEADTDQQRADALFNLANCHYRLDAYAKAVTLYQDVLRYRPDDAAVVTNLQLAVAMLARRVEQDSTGGTGGQGRGPRGVRMPDATEVAGGNLSLDDRAPDAPPAQPTPDTAHVAAQDAMRGAYQAQPVVSQAQEFVDSEWVFEPTTDDSMQLRAANLLGDDSSLWQRVFEGELEISAPLDAPREVEALPPW